MARIFISYTRRDKSTAQTYVEELRMMYEHHDVWYDNSLHGGEDWWRHILRQIDACDVFIFLISNRSLQSYYCQQEIQYAVEQNKQILPVMINSRVNLNNAPPPIQRVINRLQYIETYRLSQGRQVTQLLASVNRLLDRAQAAPEQRTETYEVGGNVDAQYANFGGTINIHNPPSMSDPGGNNSVLIAIALIGAAGTIFAALIGVVGPSVIDRTPATQDPYTEIITLASNFSGGNTDWTPQVWTFADDPASAEMVIVPVGSFEMGSPTNESGHDSDEVSHPQQVATPYFIDRYEVTNAEFVNFMNNHPDATDNRSDDEFEYIDTDDEDARIQQNGGTWEVLPGYDNHPVTEVTWFGARDYCDWRGGSLPAELQWEYAASGPSNWVYPWGNSFNGDIVNYCDINCESNWADADVDDGYENTAPVGSYENASWVGAYDMSGNVWEWVSSLYEDYPYDLNDGREEDTGSRTDVRRVFRGGGFSLTSLNLRSANRSDGDPDGTLNGLGFRCARS